jgi:hypothetical protein
MEILLLAVGLILLGAFTTYIIASEIPQQILEHMRRNGRYTGLGEQSPSVQSPRRIQAHTRMVMHGLRARSNWPDRNGDRPHQRHRVDDATGQRPIAQTARMQHRNQKRQPPAREG